MTPAKAIQLECKWCCGFDGKRKATNCGSEICKLNDKKMSHLKRIKAHCLDCVETRQDVKNCSGKLLHEDRLCYLHPYRFGVNPKRKSKTDTTHLDRFKFSKNTRRNRVAGELKNVSDALVGV